MTANRNSVQPQTKTKMLVAATPGAASGSVIRHSTPSRLQPSTRALSSTSCGISTMYPRRSRRLAGGQRPHTQADRRQPPARWLLELELRLLRHDRLNPCLARANTYRHALVDLCATFD